MVVHTVHKGCRGARDTHEERAPIIDGLSRAPPRPRAAGHLITVNNSIASILPASRGRQRKKSRTPRGEIS